VEFSATVEDIEADHTAARLALKAAEKALIEYALTLAPPKIRETLRQGIKEVKIREQLINTVMKLDTKTVHA
jgi:hypothetical protein